MFNIFRWAWLRELRGGRLRQPGAAAPARVSQTLAELATTLNTLGREFGIEATDPKSLLTAAVGALAQRNQTTALAITSAELAWQTVATLIVETRTGTPTHQTRRRVADIVTQQMFVLASFRTAVSDLDKKDERIRQVLAQL